jgi:hypothetical protein
MPKIAQCICQQPIQKLNLHQGNLKLFTLFCLSLHVFEVYIIDKLNIMIKCHVFINIMLHLCFTNLLFLITD